MRVMSFTISEGNGDEGIELSVTVPDLDEMDETNRQAMYDAFCAASTPRVKIQNRLRDRYRDGVEKAILEKEAQEHMDAILAGRVYQSKSTGRTVVDAAEGGFSADQIAMLEAAGALVVNKDDASN